METERRVETLADEVDALSRSREKVFQALAVVDESLNRGYARLLPCHQIESVCGSVAIYPLA